MRNPVLPFFRFMPLLLASLLFSPAGWGGGGFPDRLQILSLLEKQDFDGLERLLGGLQAAAEKDIAEEEKADFAFRTFMTTRPGVEALVQKWAAARPKSYAAQLAAGWYFLNLGLERRGEAYSDETSKGQFAGMEAAFEQAVPHLKAALALNPKPTGAYDALINIAMFQGQDEREAALLRKGLEVAPASYRIRRAHMQALLPRWGGRYEAMRQFAAQSQAYAAQSPKLKLLQGLVAWDQGVDATNAGHYEKAEKLLTEALASGGDSLVYFWRSKALFYLKRYDQALQDAEAALRLWPQTGDYLVTRAYASGGLGRAEEAAADLELATTLDPGAWSLQDATHWIAEKLVYQGYEASQKGRFDEAGTRFDRAAKLNPRQPETYYWRGLAFLKAQRYDQAQADFAQALRLDPAHFESAQNLDFLYARAQRWDEVVGLWNRFLADSPTKAEAYLERAGALRRKGNLPAALDDLKKACGLGNAQACQIHGQQQQQGAASPWQ